MIGKFGKLGIVIVAGALAVGLALSIRLANQPPPDFPPPANLADVLPAYPADPGGPTKAELASSLRDGREAEAAPMSRWPGVARREGDALTIAVNGRDLARFTDSGYCDGFDQCSRWRFQGVMTLGGKAYPWLTFFHGEGWETAYLVTSGGELIGAMGDPVVSPDGRWLVVAFNDPDVGGGVRIFEVRPEGPVLVAGSDLGCEAKGWPDGGNLSLACLAEPQGVVPRWLSAELVRGESGWRVRPLGELDPVHKKSLVKPTASLTEIAIPALEDEEDGGVGLAYEVSKGYRKLV
jgi:hypothetical protein